MTRWRRGRKPTETSQHARTLAVHEQALGRRLVKRAANRMESWMMKKVLIGLALGATIIGSGALAHTDKAKHGGIVQAASDLSFELVPKGDVATIYVEDHGKPYATAGMSGKLTVLNGTEKSEAELRPAGDNRLEARGVKLGKGAKAVASLATAQKKTVTVRFAVK